MAVRSFKSVGQIASSAQDAINAIERTPITIGIVTPLRQSQNGGDDLVELSTDVGAQLANNLRDLLTTNHGERVARYDYGANLGPLVTEYELGREQFEDQAMQRITQAIEKYMPYVELYDFQSNFGDIARAAPTTNQSIIGNGLGFVTIDVSYAIPRATVPKRWLRLSFTLA
jgi:phage baseplate assembly protein W